MLRDALIDLSQHHRPSLHTQKLIASRSRRLLKLDGEGDVPYATRDGSLIVAAEEWIGEHASLRDALRHQIGLPTPALSVPPVKLLAFYLPQFHPIPENDEWWGEGFTDWTNVKRARPLFFQHYQPHVPSELGYYDLRDHDVLNVQAGLAQAYGIYGFCYYYYWFSGRRVLERPIDHLLQSGQPRLPFCFCWANENWTRRWDGREDEVLLRQDYTGDWEERLIRDLLPAFVDDRYIRINDAPLLLVYRADVIPQCIRVADRWREIAQAEAGLDLHLAAVQSHGLVDPTPFGFDAAVEFPPHNLHVPANPRKLQRLDPGFDGFLGDYGRLMRARLALPLPEYPWYRGLIPSWDNTPRRGVNAHVLVNSSPDEYRLWLRKAVLQSLVRSPAQAPLVFINAWNEWGEGTHLEPDTKYGRQWLEATRGGLLDGLRQYFASRAVAVTEAQALEYVTASVKAL